MTLLSIIIFLLVGGISGWLAGLLITGRGFGIVGDIIVGIIGAVIVAFIGAVILLSVIKLIKKI
ncbi:GlsB/YeaQ/YmgE family stress response membrane protein [Acidithiobacillus ferridurans]|uniref:GlsB/YeaQ/YmgE family stress response membrane protein n=1 Tax=Acidithiobacillus ferridurans TaxID=1232575 RepID=UPI001C068039|nr:GlsB/YeaQ/YmgE family stress response membrane protein [Acidithiobacillus ferridurans]MBU2733514.1 GlsB/YeaQ/YmgE family stress response membrane protein [Acidithiobacillus ferridurans]